MRTYRISVGAILLALCVFNPASTYPQADKPLTKKTDNGLEVSLLKVELVRERDDLNQVPIYRMGSCPPGAAGNGIKMFANSGTQVYFVRLGIKVLPEYKGGGVKAPTITDADDKKYVSKNTMLPDSLLNDLTKLKGQQLECEFPFEVRFGKQLKELQYGAISFSLIRSEPATKP
jgi:hypothetical protein